MVIAARDPDRSVLRFLFGRDAFGRVVAVTPSWTEAGRELFKCVDRILRDAGMATTRWHFATRKLDRHPAYYGRPVPEIPENPVDIFHPSLAQVPWLELDHAVKSLDAEWKVSDQPARLTWTGGDSESFDFTCCDQRLEDAVVVCIEHKLGTVIQIEASVSDVVRWYLGRAWLKRAAGGFAFEEPDTEQ
jgi:hypothetical protein